MITLNDYLYSGDTILRILHNYIHDLRAEAKKTHNEVDLIRPLNVNARKGYSLDIYL